MGKRQALSVQRILHRSKPSPACIIPGSRLSPPIPTKTGLIARDKATYRPLGAPKLNSPLGTQTLNLGLYNHVASQHSSDKK